MSRAAGLSIASILGTAAMCISTAGTTLRAASAVPATAPATAPTMSKRAAELLRLVEADLREAVKAQTGHAARPKPADAASDVLETPPMLTQCLVSAWVTCDPAAAREAGGPALLDEITAISEASLASLSPASRGVLSETMRVENALLWDDRKSAAEGIAKLDALAAKLAGDPGEMSFKSRPAAYRLLSGQTDPAAESDADALALAILLAEIRDRSELAASLRKRYVVVRSASLADDHARSLAAGDVVRFDPNAGMALARTSKAAASRARAIAECVRIARVSQPEWTAVNAGQMLAEAEVLSRNGDDASARAARDSVLRAAAETKRREVVERMMRAKPVVARGLTPGVWNEELAHVLCAAEVGLDRVAADRLDALLAVRPREAGERRRAESLDLQIASIELRIGRTTSAEARYAIVARATDQRELLAMDEQMYAFLDAAVDARNDALIERVVRDFAIDASDQALIARRRMRNLITAGRIDDAWACGVSIGRGPMMQFGPLGRVAIELERAGRSKDLDAKIAALPDADTRAAVRLAVLHHLTGKPSDQALPWLRVE
jgi:hypothetical protein